ncbi:DNA polymerase delta subunit 4 [Scleropages formosus]|nr:DNA polymerase delta subunit 4 [Scleropages formosus]
MSPKRRLITDSFKVVKRARAEQRVEKKEEEPPEPPEPEPESRSLTPREKDLQELRKFDLDWRFGPCTGIGRLQRWDRASHHGLDPPREVRELLLKKSADPEYTHCLWHELPL